MTPEELVAAVCDMQGEGVTPDQLGEVTVTVYLNGTRKMISYACQAKAPPPQVPAPPELPSQPPT